jgi:hypothetical protein
MGPVVVEDASYAPLPDARTAPGPMQPPRDVARAVVNRTGVKRLPEMGPMPSAATAGEAPPGPPVHIVNERSIRLNCRLRDVGPSGVSAVELWYTADGRHWQKSERTLDPKPPYVLDFKEDGRFGIILLAHSGMGIGREPPQLGEAPQVWVEVDTTRPTVKLGKVKYGAGSLTLTWSASDRSLTPRPIRLSYATAAAGPWQVIAEGENAGAFTWKLPAAMPTRFLIRVEATDTAGNVGIACTPEPVLLDLARPTLDILSVESNRHR